MISLKRNVYGINVVHNHPQWPLKQYWIKLSLDNQ